MSKMGEREDYNQVPIECNSGDAVSRDSELHSADTRSVLDMMVEPVVGPGAVRLSLRLLQVGRDLREVDFCFEPVLLAMVSAAIEMVEGLSEAKKRMLVESVARSLFENVESRERLQRLWMQLKSSESRFS